jgi:hypothetical protein
VKGLFDAPTADEIRSRIARLAPDSPRQWGTMNPAQMVAHCAEFMRIATGEIHPPRMLLGRLIGPIVRRVALRDERPSPRNMPTVPGFAIADEREFSSERNRLAMLVDRFVSGGANACTTTPHSFFGRLTPEQWSALMYKHLDHHLRQFGA